jgi:hypothetical protein
MQFYPRVLACSAFAAVATLAVGLAAAPVVTSLGEGGAMPAAQQNDLVHKYCAVCHDDAHRNGGLSLEHFDAARVDPGVAAMLVSKLKANALGAAGLPLPDKATQDGLRMALSAASAGADLWTVDRTLNSRSRTSTLTAGIVKEVPSAADGREPTLYRLTLTCDADTRDGEVQLAWSPGVPGAGRFMSASVDGRTLPRYALSGKEKMGNGGDGTSGPGAVTIYRTKASAPASGAVMSLPVSTLSVGDVFAGETVVFPFEPLPPQVRNELATCFPRERAGR